MAFTFDADVQFNKKTHQLITGTGTAGTTGSASAAYVPSLWKFDLSMTPVAGDILTVKIPVAGVNSGVWMSVDNGTNYYPVALQGATRLQNEYTTGYTVMVVYETGINTTTYGTTSAGAAKGASTSTYTGGRWHIINFRDTNTTYSNVALGHGYATCTTAAATAAKVASLSSYALTTGGIVAVKFSYDVPANATLNVNSKGAKAIYYKGAAIPAGIINAGDTATFIYSTYYHLISVDSFITNAQIDALFT